MASIEQRIKKCLALADDSGATKHERLAALKMARKLMATHHIKGSDLANTTTSNGYYFTINAGGTCWSSAGGGW